MASLRRPLIVQGGLLGGSLRAMICHVAACVDKRKLRNYTVDGSEIRRSPVEGTVVYPNIYKVLNKSQVVQDFFYQQYVLLFN